MGAEPGSGGNAIDLDCCEDGCKKYVDDEFYFGVRARG
jgi:hypothetical protein